MQLSDLVADVHDAFVRNAWEFEGYGIPYLQDVDTVMRQMHDRLRGKPDGTVIEVGNVSMRKAGDGYDLYVRLGTFKETV